MGIRLMNEAGRCLHILSLTFLIFPPKLLPQAEYNLHRADYMPGSRVKPRGLISGLTFIGLRLTRNSPTLI